MKINYPGFVEHAMKVDFFMMSYFVSSKMRPSEKVHEGHVMIIQN